MNRRVLKYNVAAALFSTAFLFGGNQVFANTYNNVINNVDNNDNLLLLEFDDGKVVITNHSKIINEDFDYTVAGQFNWDAPKQQNFLKKENGTELLTKEDYSYDQFYEVRYRKHQNQLSQNPNDYTFVTASIIRNVPSNMSDTMYTEYKDIVAYKTNSNGQYEEKTLNEVQTAITNFNKKYNTNLKFEPNGIGEGLLYSGAEYWCITEPSWNIETGDLTFKNSKTFKLGEGIANDEYYNKIATKKDIITYKDYSYKAKKADLEITDNSFYENHGKIYNIGDIKVNNGSILSITKGEYWTDTWTVQKYTDATIECNNIITDGNIITTDMGYTVLKDSKSKYVSTKYNSDFSQNDSIRAEKITTENSIKAKGNITAKIGNITAKCIDADGSIKATNVTSDGNISSSTNIATKGKAKGNFLNVATINSTSASITGDLSINGNFTMSNQAKLNGGAVLSNKKITSLGSGTLSTISTEAVNGAQLNAIKQKFTGRVFSASSDIEISAEDAISVTKLGTVDKGNTGIVTGGTVYKITNALNQSLDSLKASVSSHQSTLTTLSQGLSDLKSSVTNINSSVASATKNLSAQLTNRLQSDMGNLSDDGKNVIRNMVSSTLKSMNNMSAKETTLSPVATYEAKENASNTELDTIHASLDTKASKGDFSGLASSVDSNSKQVEDNSQAIQKNASAISDLQLTKADADGSNISVDGYSEKLGTGRVESGNHELVNGNAVYDALSNKADIGYVDSGLGMVSSQLDAMSQGLTQDMNRVGAGAAALAGLHPTSYDASDKLSFAYGGGHYKNANTSALGAFYHPNERTMVSVAGTIGNNDAMLSAGVSIKVGIGDSVSKVIVTPKMFSAQEVTNQNMKDHLDTQSERLQQIESTLQSRISG